MMKFFVGSVWFLVVFGLSSFVAANYLEERLISKNEYEEQDQLGPKLVEPAVDKPITKILPPADGSLHIYALPVGQGDAHILQCPNGDVAIIDLGTAESESEGFWTANEVITFLNGQVNRIRNIVITHNHEDHYSLLSRVFTDKGNLTALENIYISCDRSAMEEALSNWIDLIEASAKLRTFNGGKTCGSSNGVPCESITLCPADSLIEFQVLSANAWNCTAPNIDSIVIGITHGTFKMQLNGDFGDDTEDVNEDGPQKKMVDFYGDGLAVTVYKLAQHGGDTWANKPIMRDAVRAKAVYASAKTWSALLRHPKCVILDYFIANNYLCKPNETDAESEFYCGEHPSTTVDKLQTEYACGLDQSIRIVTANEFAIYTTTPSTETLNLIHLVTDGTKWGFINDIQPRITRP